MLIGKQDVNLLKLEIAVTVFAFGVERRKGLAFKMPAAFVLWSNSNDL